MSNVIKFPTREDDTAQRIADLSARLRLLLEEYPMESILLTLGTLAQTIEDSQLLIPVTRLILERQGIDIPTE